MQLSKQPRNFCWFFLAKDCYQVCTVSKSIVGDFQHWLGDFNRNQAIFEKKPSFKIVFCIFLVRSTVRIAVSAVLLIVHIQKKCKLRWKKHLPEVSPPLSFNRMQRKSLWFPRFFLITMCFRETQPSKTDFSMISKDSGRVICSKVGRLLKAFFFSTVIPTSKTSFVKGVKSFQLQASSP